MGILVQVIYGEGGCSQQKGHEENRKQQGKVLSKDVASAGDLVQPDPTGSSGVQIAPQSQSHLEARWLLGLAFGRQQLSGEGAANTSSSWRRGTPAGKGDISRAPTASTTNSNLQGCSRVSLGIFVALPSTEVLMSTLALLTRPRFIFCRRVLEKSLTYRELSESYMVLSVIRDTPDYQYICWGYHLHTKLCQELTQSQSPRTLLMSSSHTHSYAP